MKTAFSTLLAVQTLLTTAWCISCSGSDRVALWSGTTTLSCFIYDPTAVQKNFADSYADCSAMAGPGETGGLAKVNSDWLYHGIKAKWGSTIDNAWIALKYDGVGVKTQLSSWDWVDVQGNPVEPLDGSLYTGLTINPMGSQEYCMRWSGAAWADRNCNSNLKKICEIRKDVVVAQPPYSYTGRRGCTVMGPVQVCSYDLKAG